jgi:branched-chain amino acid transport system ATP-binding protein
VLSLKKLSKRFGGVVAVDQVDLALAQGEVHALIGPNGAGKTTLISLISGTMPSDQGEIYFRNQELTRSKPHARVAAGLARSYQITSIFRRFSVLDNLALAVQARSGSSFSFWKPGGGGKRLVRRGSQPSRRKVGLARNRLRGRNSSRTANNARSRSASRSPRARSSCCSTSRWPAWGRRSRSA